MTAAIAHRGPDDMGAWCDPEAGIALGHRRLSILDLSLAGHQPMTSASGRFVIVYNGEIYNHRDLRAELEELGAAPSWRGHSDTEVLLAAIDRWGVRATLERLNGMFAFALWDRETRTLTLARDRVGEKPLYFGHSGDLFLFGSELKALTAHPCFERTVNRDALALFLRHNYVPAPHSIWCGIGKLPPAHYVEIQGSGRHVGDPVCYWDFRSVAEKGITEPLDNGPHLIDQLEALLANSVARRMEADVRLGAFLSGGIDSSTIVALMQAQSSQPVRSFTIGFHEEGFNEAVHAKAVAAHLGTDHTELYVTPRDALALVPRLPKIWDEPFSDCSQIPTFLVSEMTRRHVTVSMSGDGGDELFGGYHRYFAGMKLWTALSRLPEWARRTLADALGSRGSLAAATMAMRLLPARCRHLALSERLPRLARIIAECDPDAVYRRLVSHMTEPEEIVIGGRKPERWLAGESPAFGDFRQRMMYVDTLTYLPDDILTKLDRASMAVSLEARLPFLDHRVIEFAWRLPMAAKMDGDKGKIALRELLCRYVPPNLVERPKMGFNVPIDSWLKGPLREWAEDLLDEGRLRSEGFFEPVPIRRLWEAYLSGEGRRHYWLWDVLMFQAWWAEQRPGN